MTRTFYKQANGIIVVFDVTNQESFASVKRWIGDIHQHADPSIIKVLVGNKIDLPDDRVVSSEDGKATADQYKINYFEVSAKQNLNLEEVFQRVMTQVYDKLYAG